MSEEFYALSTDEAERWREVLGRCTAYDVYHLPGYHRLGEEQEGARARLFVCELDSGVIAMPLLIRRIEEIPGLEGAEYVDFTSVYGYPGPVSYAESPPIGETNRFAEKLHDWLKGEGGVCAFSRLNPLLNQEPLLRAEGEVLPVGPTVAMDLSLPPAEQWQQYRDNHKRDIEHARDVGVTCLCDESWSHLDDFIEIYYETMRRVDADDYYFFDRAYFTHLRDLLGEHIRLFVAVKEDEVIAGALFTICNSIIQYHLGGTRTRHRALSPTKLMFDTVRMWGNDMGARALHLGGGVGAKRDGLFRFKTGFSDRTYQFSVWRTILNQGAYRELTERKRAWNEEHGLEISDPHYFPTYRAPTS